MKNLNLGVMKTAIDYLYEQLVTSDKNEFSLDELTSIYDQAKLIEKEQIIESHRYAYLICGFEHSAEDCSNEYYFETYEDQRSNTNH